MALTFGPVTFFTTPNVRRKVVLPPSINTAKFLKPPRFVLATKGPWQPWERERDYAEDARDREWQEFMKNFPEPRYPQIEAKRNLSEHNWTIFISIASYRDPEINQTLDGMISKAVHPDLLRVTVHFQETEEFLSVDPKEYLPENLALNPNIKLIPGDYKNAAGAGPSRSLIQQYYNNETYYMQLDSHHRFKKGWDIELIMQLEGLRRSTSKPLISQYLNRYEANWTMGKIEREFKEGRSMR